MAKQHDLCGQLRDVIESRGLTPTELAGLSGVDRAMISRFMDGTRDLRFRSAARIAAALGLRLVEVARPEGRGRPAKRAGKA